MVFVVSNNCISAVLQAGYASLQNSTDIPQKLLSLQYLFTHFLGHYLSCGYMVVNLPQKKLRIAVIIIAQIFP